MISLYSTLEFVHVTAALVWVGGVIAVGVLSARLSRNADAAAMRLLATQGAFFGRAVMGPAAGVTLLAGIALMGVIGGPPRLWMLWGMAGVVLSVLLGAVFLRRSNQRLVELTWDTNGTPNGEATRLRRRIAALGMLNTAILLSTVWAMVAKPML